EGGYDKEHRRERQRSVEVAGQELEDRQRQRLRAVLVRAGEQPRRADLSARAGTGARSRRPELAERPPPRQRRPGCEPRPRPGDADPRERPRLAGPERPRGVEKVPIERLEGGDPTAHAERRGA